MLSNFNKAFNQMTEEECIHQAELDAITQLMENTEDYVSVFKKWGLNKMLSANTIKGYSSLRDDINYIYDNVNIWSKPLNICHLTLVSMIEDKIKELEG